MAAAIPATVVHSGHFCRTYRAAAQTDAGPGECEDPPGPLEQPAPPKYEGPPSPSPSHASIGITPGRPWAWLVAVGRYAQTFLRRWSICPGFAVTVVDLPRLVPDSGRCADV